MFGRRRTQQYVCVERHVVRGPEPIGSDTESGLDAVWGLGMAGAAGSHIPIGMPSGTCNVNRFSGDGGPIQNFGRGRFMGATPSIKRSLYEEQTGVGQAGVSSTANPVLRAMLVNGSAI